VPGHPTTRPSARLLPVGDAVLPVGDAVTGSGALTGSAPGDERSGGDEARLWLAVGLFRLVGLVYAVTTFAVIAGRVPRPWAGWLVLGLITAWSGLLAWLRVPPTRLVVADLVIAVAAVLATRVVDDPSRPGFADQTLPAMWAAAAVLGWGVWRGWRAGLVASAVVALADLVEIGWRPSSSTIYNIILVVLAGGVVGYAVDVFRAGRRNLARAVAVEAAARERERLAADIHDSVLQVLAFVQRRGGEIGGEAAALGRLAGEQETRLRALVAASPDGPGGTGEQDVRAALSGFAGGRATLIGPAEPVLLPVAAVQALVAAAGAALDNVARHAGADAKVWILVEDEPDAVTVTVRDDGPGIAPGRLAEAVAAGRLGVAASIRGRICAVGGRVDVVSVPGQGTEVEMRVPR
jgi:signal transduction histidine kinase